jgi:NAD+ diphosphatase
MPHNFKPAMKPHDHAVGPAAWIVVRERNVLVQQGTAEFADHETASLLPTGDAVHYLGTLEDRPVWGVGVDDAQYAPEGYEFIDLFTLYARTGGEEWILGGRAVQIIEWGRHHRFCGRCGRPTEPVDNDRSMRCPSCNILSYPRLSPAVIMLVHRGDDEILLARGRQFRVPMYTTLAGFVEPGESVEEAVRREIEEEVGLQVGDVHYQGSQPWPFPNSLMLGFYAEYESGDIHIDETELMDAQWYRTDALPNIPGPISIANRLITGFIAARR